MTLQAILGLQHGLTETIFTQQTATSGADICCSKHVREERLSTDAGISTTDTSVYLCSCYRQAVSLQVVHGGLHEGLHGGLHEGLQGGLHGALQGGQHGGPKVAKGDALGKDVLRTPSSSSLSIMLLQSLLAMSVIDLPLLRVYERFVCCITQPQSLAPVNNSAFVVALITTPTAADFSKLFGCLFFLLCAA